MGTQAARSAFDTESLARELLALLGTGRQVSPPSQRFPEFDLATGYRVADAIRALRRLRNETPVGRKIGFTNYRMWEAYGIAAPIWASVYDTTVLPIANNRTFDLTGWPEPKIEPEIIFRLAAAPAPGLSESQLLGCIEWYSLGFELVHCIYPGWRCVAADSVAGFGLHAALLVGERHAPGPGSMDELTNFRIALERNGTVVDEGEAAMVLGGPLTALKHLNDLVNADPAHAPLAAGEIITTGTITLAAAVSPGEEWSAVPSGLDAPPIRLGFA